MAEELLATRILSNGSATHNTILTQTSSASAIDNFTNYDTWVKRATPFLLTAFNKKVTQESPRWAETRLLCLTASNITEGSRAPASDAASNREMRWKVLLVAGLSVLISATASF
jgi:hypothetical protein